MQLGGQEETYFYNGLTTGPYPSAWNVFPTEENPTTRYKYVSAEINFGKDLQEIER